MRSLTLSPIIECSVCKQIAILTDNSCNKCDASIDEDGNYFPSNITWRFNKYRPLERFMNKFGRYWRWPQFIIHILATLLGMALILYPLTVRPDAFIIFCIPAALCFMTTYATTMTALPKRGVSYTFVSPNCYIYFSLCIFFFGFAISLALLRHTLDSDYWIWINAALASIFLIGFIYEHGRIKISGRGVSLLKEGITIDWKGVDFVYLTREWKYRNPEKMFRENYSENRLHLMLKLKDPLPVGSITLEDKKYDQAKIQPNSAIEIDISNYSCEPDELTKYLSHFHHNVKEEIISKTIKLL